MSCRGVACQHKMINGVFSVLPFSCASDGTSKNVCYLKQMNRSRKGHGPPFNDARYYDIFSC